MTLTYLVIPSNGRLTPDGPIVFLTGAQIIQAFGVDKSACLVVPEGEREHPSNISTVGLIRLKGQKSGTYKVPK